MHEREKMGKRTDKRRARSERHGQKSRCSDGKINFSISVIQRNSISLRCMPNISPSIIQFRWNSVQMRIVCSQPITRGFRMSATGFERGIVCFSLPAFSSYCGRMLWRSSCRNWLVCAQSRFCHRVRQYDVDIIIYVFCLQKSKQIAPAPHSTTAGEKKAQFTVHIYSFFFPAKNINFSDEIIKFDDIHFSWVANGNKAIPDMNVCLDCVVVLTLDAFPLLLKQYYLLLPSGRRYQAHLHFLCHAFCHISHA